MVSTGMTLKYDAIFIAKNTGRWRFEQKLVGLKIFFR